MTSPVTGEPTGATFAFSGMLIKLFNQYQPTHVAMAMDADAKTFRDDFYPEYKANREAPPDEFKQQIGRMVEVAKLFGLPVIEQAGFEADDIMATLAARISRGDFDDVLPGAVLRMVAKDKDLEQVIGDRVELFDVHTDQSMDAAALLEKRGITPQQVIDYQTLIGDSTDNIPGVKGIGPKTAQRVVNELKDKAPTVMAMAGRAPAASDPDAVPEDLPATAPRPTPAAPPPSRGAAQAEALSALTNLGYAPGEAAGAVAEAAGADAQAETPALIRAALRLLAPKG